MRDTFKIHKTDVSFLICYLSVVAIGFWTPLNVLDIYPQAKAFTAFMSDWIYQIKRVGEVSRDLSQANTFVYAVAWCVMPICAMHMNYVSIRESIVKKFHIAIRSWPKRIFQIGICTYAVWFMWLQPTDPFDDRLGRVLFLNETTRHFFAPGNVWLIMMCPVWVLLDIVSICLGRVTLEEGTKNGR